MKHRRDAELVHRACAMVAGGNNTTFGRMLGHSDGSTVRKWLAEARGLTHTDRRLLRVIVAHPEVAQWMAHADDVTAA